MMINLKFVHVCLNNQRESFIASFAESSRQVFCISFFKDDCISVRVSPFVSGRSKYT